jgi:hypothetical protein
MKSIVFESMPESVRAKLMECRVDMPVYYVGRQWAVTSYGIEQIADEVGVKPYYHIHASSLRQSMGEGGWVGHMAGKRWVDTDDFSKAYEIALRVHPEEGQ